jgi:hypothetical protein
MLVELYTSEGCDSCPPADAWLARIAGDSAFAKGVVPIAFHVDYWDYIGWKDPFASPAYTARQREIAARGGARFAYTPQVVVAGRDYRAWSDAPRFASAVRASNAKPARASIAITHGIAEGEGVSLKLEAVVSDVAARVGAVAYLGVYEDGLSSRITAGENRGATLGHDRVIRAWLGPFGLDAAGRVEVERRAALPRGASASGVVAVVENRLTGDVLQALAAPACR